MVVRWLAAAGLAGVLVGACQSSTSHSSAGRAAATTVPAVTSTSGPVSSAPTGTAAPVTTGSAASTVTVQVAGQQPGAGATIRVSEGDRTLVTQTSDQLPFDYTIVGWTASATVVVSATPMPRSGPLTCTIHIGPVENDVQTAPAGQPAICTSH